MWADCRRASTFLALTLLSASLLATVVLLPGTAAARTLYVGGGGPGNYTTIQTAVDDADPGDTVYVYAGTYRQIVRINKTISLLGENRDTTIITYSIGGGLISVEADWVNVTGFSLVSDWSHPGMVGMYLWYSWNCTISNNIFRENWYGLSLQESGNATIADNLFVENWEALELVSSPDSRIHGNEIRHALGTAMYIRTSPNVTVSHNNISSNGGGLRLGSTYDIIKANTFQGNGIALGGASVSHFNTHDISTDNTVNGRPIRYYKDCQGLNIDGIQLGQLIIGNCTDVDISNLHINGTDIGIQLGFVSGATISGNNISTNRLGIHFMFSEETIIEENDIWGNGVGINTYYSHDITLRDNMIFTNSTIHCSNGVHPFRSTNIRITGNTFSRCGEGVYIQRSEDVSVTMNEFFSGAEGVRTWVSSNLTIGGNDFSEYSTALRSFHTTNVTVTRNNILGSGYASIRFQDGHDITITGNSIADGERGIVLEDTSSALVHHNNLINNTLQAYDDSGANNSWDDGYPSGGNYWSDYEGVDNCSGPNQDICPDPDGIGDTPYVIDGDTRDNYPLMAPWSPPFVWKEALYGPVLGNAIQVWSTSPDVPLSSEGGPCRTSSHSACAHASSLASQSVPSREDSAQMVTRRVRSP